MSDALANLLETVVLLVMFYIIFQFGLGTAFKVIACVAAFAFFVWLPICYYGHERGWRWLR